MGSWLEVPTYTARSLAVFISKKLKSTKGRPTILHTASFDLFGVFMRPPRVEEECVPLSAVSVIQPSSCIVTAAAVRNNPRVASQGHDGQCGITKVMCDSDAAAAIATAAQLTSSSQYS